MLSNTGAGESRSHQGLSLFRRNAKDGGQLGRTDAMPVHEHGCFALGIFHQAPHGLDPLHQPTVCLNKRPAQLNGVWLARITGRWQVTQIRPARQLRKSCQLCTPRV
jgi:hypothetical protein